MKRKRKVIVCPCCGLGSERYVYQTDCNEKVFTVIGGSIGVLTGVLKLFPVVPGVPAVTARWVLKTIGAGLSLSNIGKTLGAMTDDLIFVRYRCSKCDTKFKL